MDGALLKTATMSTSKDAKIVVVGAGFAGVAAAVTLVQAGFQQVKILEANGRVGGRAYTTKPFTENIIELGANWIHGQVGNPLYQLAKDNNLLQSLPDNSDDYYFKDRKHLSDTLVKKVISLFENLNTKASASELDPKYRNMTLGDYLDAAFAKSSLASSEDGKRIFEWCKRNHCTHNAASSLFEVSADEMSEYAQLEGEFYNTLGPGGYRAVLEVLLKRLPPGTVLSSKPVKTIKWNSQGTASTSHPVKVVCENNEIFEADHVIVTVSLGVLKKQAATMFEPALPNPKLDAIKSLGFGVVDKIFLYFSERFWPEDCAAIQLVWDKGPEDKSVYTSQIAGDEWKKTWFKKISGFDAVARHPTALLGWITGREALHMETLTDSEVKDTCLRLLRSSTGWSVPDVSRIVISRWGHDQRVLGSYTYIPKGVNGVKKQEALAAPLPGSGGKVLFAGEATHLKCFTTTHGAYLSGVREGQRLINHYSKKP